MLLVAKAYKSMARMVNGNPFRADASWQHTEIYFAMTSQKHH